MLHCLKVGRWAAICTDGKGEDSFGEAVSEDAIPSGIRRRMGRLERLVVRCSIGVLHDQPSSELIFCSRYGNLETLVSLLRNIAEEQLISPMAFSGSVHNAAPGLVGQILKKRLGHTALAAGPNSLAAGLTEAYARLATGECQDVTLMFADVPLPEVYSDFEEEDLPGVAMATRLQLADANSAEPAIAVRPGREGVLHMLSGMKKGPVNLALREVGWTRPVQ